ncbi:hypothetical protein INT47_003510 [Mucor saturninus]|uniref:CCHC-type domain-containing protein n=1 Tax=Mucor saturninus TaxID=64648 RepID=A0A8H7USI1_9FUNG|nr:hypothetical protein INT47_003510 [Mucor saturninus]
MSISPYTTWADIVAVGNGKKVLRHVHVSDETDSDFKLASTIIYEDESLEALILTKQALSIVNQQLTVGSVLFSFPATVFKHRVDAYNAIQSQCGRIHGVRPISYYGVPSDSNMLLEVKFKYDNGTTKAITSGVSVKDKTFKGFRTNFSDKNNLVHVKLSILHIPDQENFLEDLMTSLAYYGQILQIKEYSCGGYFEGQMSVNLNTGVGYTDEDDEYHSSVPLSNNLYLSEWDCFAASTSKGAPSVCHWCHVAGHIRSKCPELARPNVLHVIPPAAEVSENIDSGSTDCLDANILSDSDTALPDVSISPKIASRGSEASKFATTVVSVPGEVDHVMDTATLPSSKVELVGRSGGTDKGVSPKRSVLVPLAKLGKILQKLPPVFLSNSWSARWFLDLPLQCVVTVGDAVNTLSPTLISSSVPLLYLVSDIFSRNQTTDNLQNTRVVNASKVKEVRRALYPSDGWSAATGFMPTALHNQTIRDVLLPTWLPALYHWTITQGRGNMFTVSGIRPDDLGWYCHPDRAKFEIRPSCLRWFQPGSYFGPLYSGSFSPWI